MDKLALLNDDLLRAHEVGDLAALVTLYARAGDLALADGDIDAGCFYTTHAYVFALQDGRAEANDLRAKLVRYGRET